MKKIYERIAKNTKILAKKKFAQNCEIFAKKFPQFAENPTTNTLKKSKIVHLFLSWVRRVSNIIV